MSEAVKQALREHHAAVVADALEALDSPEYTASLYPGFRAPLRRYLADRIETGGFLRCVLENDLLGALGRGSSLLVLDQMRAMRELLIGYFPANSFGSKEAVAAWLASGKDDPT